MKHRVIKPGWYGKGLAGGEFAWLIEDQHILTRDTTVPLPGENVLFLDAHLWQGTFYFGGKGGRTDTAWLWNGTEWKNLGVAAANYPLAFEANKVYISTGGAVDVYDLTTLTLIESRPIAVGVNGIRQVIGGVIISGDNTYHSPEMGINEYTQMVELYTGIQTATDAAIVWDGQRRVLFAEGRTRFVKADRKGNDICVSFQDQAANEGHLFWFTRAEVTTLPLDEAAVQEPVVTVDRWTLDDVLNGKEFVFHDSANPDLGYASRVWVENGIMYARIVNATGQGQTALQRRVKPCSQKPTDPIDPPDPEPEPDTRMRPVAFGPNLGSGDFRILFTEDNLWPCHAKLAGFHFYGQNVLPIMQELVGPNTYQNLKDSNAFKKCKEWGLTTEMELAGPPEQAYEAETKIAEAEGRLDMLSYDDTFSGIGIEDFAAWVREYRETRPQWIILVYAAFPMVSIDQIIARVKAWFALGARPDVIRMDIDPGVRSRYTAADHAKIRAFCDTERIGLQYVVNARDGLTEVAYCQEAWNWHQTAEALGKWDGRIVQSWATARGSSDRTLPRNLREGEAGAFTTLLKQVLEAHEPVVPSTPTASRPLVGPLRIVNKSYADDTGPRRVLFCSWFPALRIFRDNRSEALAQLDRIAAAGWQGIRMFTAVGNLPYWAGREVVPITCTQNGVTRGGWPDYDQVVTDFFRACHARGLRLQLTTGDAQVMLPRREDKIAHAQRIARLVNAVSPDLVVLHENVNEGWQNGYPENDMGLHHDVMRAFHDGCSVPLCGNSAAFGDSEEPDNLTHLSEGAPLAIVHGTRHTAERAATRAFNLVYWEGNPRGFPKPFWQGEPTGPDGSSHEVYAPVNDPNELLAIYACQQMTGQASVFFNGPAIRYQEPLDVTWGFTEFPRLLAHIPEDIGQWPHVSHGNKPNTPIGARRFADQGSGPARVDQVWNDSQVVCVVHHGSGPWELLQRRPMRWQIFSAAGLEAEGEGTFPAMNASMVARLIIGTFLPQDQDTPLLRDIPLHLSSDADAVSPPPRHFMTNWRVWLQGLLAAVIGGAASAVSVIAIDPATFNLDTGFINVGKVALVAAVINLASYLKEHPVPPIEHDNG